MLTTIGVNLRIRRRRRLPIYQDINRRNLRDNTNFLELPEERFFANFRVSKNVFFMLLQEMEPRMGVHFRSTHIPAAIKLATFLSFVGTGGYQYSIGNEMTSAISKSKVSIIINECLNIFDAHLCPKWIVLNKTAQEENATKENFYLAGGIPSVVGCVDGTHVRIKAPDNAVKHLYYNRKGFYSINVMAICDDKMIITYVDARHPGANHDAFVWNHSSADNYFKQQFLNGKRNTWLLGDSGYKLLPYMLTPYGNPTEQWQKKFNEKHCKTRNIVERCFGVLKNRFRCIIGSRGLFYSPEKTTKIVNACCALHNICMTYKSNWVPPPSSNVVNNEINDIIDDLDDDSYEESSFAHNLRNRVAMNLQ